MTNVTKKKLNSPEYKTAQKELIKLLANNKKLSQGFVNELLTESEQVMLIKRFAAILMFQKEYSPYRVWNTLHMSPSTADRIYQQFQDGNFDNLITSIPHKNIPGWLSFIDDLIRAQASTKARARLMKGGYF